MSLQTGGRWATNVFDSQEFYFCCFDPGLRHKATLKWNDRASDLASRWRRLDLNKINSNNM